MIFQLNASNPKAFNLKVRSHAIIHSSQKPVLVNT